MSIVEPIVRVAASGEGVTASGRRLPLAAPGDLVDESGMITPGAHHNVPPCRHFPECGGCQVQHLDDASYSEYLVDRIGVALNAQGLDLPEIRAPHLSPPRTRRRASLSAERRGGRVVLGFRAEASHRIVDMRECHILRPELFALLAPLRDLLATLALGRKGASIVITLADQGPDLLLQGVEAEGLDAAEALTRFARATGVARLSLNEVGGPQARWEPEPVTVTLGGLAVPFPPGGFLQATLDGEAALVAAVCEAVGDSKTVADLFAGLGTFALALDARVLAAEGSSEAALALKSAANRAQRPIFVDRRDLFRRPLDAGELARFDAVVLDPPRAGAREQVAEIAASPVARLAYVSCNPATFARDTAILAAGGYRLAWIQPVGQFRWSTHVELASAFVR